MAVQISEVRLTELPQVMSFWAGITGATPDQEAAKLLAESIRRQPDLSLCARDQDQLIGVLLCRHDGRRGYIHYLALAPHVRNTELARQLVDKSLAKLQAHGANTCRIRLGNAHDSARLFDAARWAVGQPDPEDDQDAA
jgi:ribosomal protein S18 acetylase RimI-like enzyme